jgi:hypothetical protein
MIFGIGLSKTGLHSLTLAMTKLGFRSKRYLFPEDIQNLSEFDFVCDFPIMTRYKEFDKKNPGSKFILTTRSTESWLKSVENHLGNRSPNILTPIEIEYRIELWGTNKPSRNQLLLAYKQHLEEVQNYFSTREKDLLIFDAHKGNGWKELCGHLRIKEIPIEDFPHEGKGKYNQNSFLPRAKRHLRKLLS